MDSNFPDSEILKYLSKEQVNFLYNTDININTDIVELIEQLTDFLQKYGIENDEINESGMIVEKIIDKLADIDPEKELIKYVFVEYDLDSSGKLYCYKSNINGIYIGDSVLVETNGLENEGIVRRIGYYSKNTVPYPLNKTKNVLEVIDYDESDKVNKNIEDNDKVIYVSIVYDDDIVGKIVGNSFYYKTDIDSIKIGDKVLVDRVGKETIGEVVNVEYFNKKDVPFPIYKTKDVIKIIKSNNESKNNELSNNKKNKVYFYTDTLDKKILIIEKNDNNLENDIKLKDCTIIKVNNPKIKKHILDSDVIFVVGNIDISHYDLSKKFVVNVNNERNFGNHTAIIYLFEKELYIKMIKSLYNAIMLVGFKTIDLYDIASHLDGRMAYKVFTEKNMNELYEIFDTKTKSKLFVVVEIPETYTFSALNEKVGEIANKYSNAEFEFGVPAIENVDEFKINAFYELPEQKIPSCPNCGSEMVEIFYGLPSEEIYQKAKRKQLFLGGCSISDHSPKYYCFKCMRRYFKSLGEYQIENDEEHIYLDDDSSMDGLYARDEAINKLNYIELNKNNIDCIKNENIMFIEDGGSEGTRYFMDSKTNLYFVNVIYGNKLRIEDIYTRLPEYKNASFENKKDYNAINLGLGHALLIKTNIYDEFMEKLKNEIAYDENDMGDYYNAYCYWIKCATQFLKEREKNNGSN
jgi:hypothetical protein